MLKTLLYLTLGVAGIFLALASPLWGAVAVINAYLMNPVVFSPQLASIRFQFCITAAFIAGLVLRRSRGVPRVGSEAFVMKALILYAVVSLVSSLWAVVSPELAQVRAIDFGKTVFVAWLLPLAITCDRDMRIILWACTIGAVHAGFMHVVGGNLHWIPNRLTEEFGVIPDMQASVMVFFLPVTLLLAVTAESKKGRWFCWFGALVILDSVVNTYQRAYFVALVAEVGCLVWMLPKKLVLRMVPAGLACVVAFLFVFTPSTYWDWINTIADHESDGSASSRIILMNCSLAMFSDYPMGVGYANYGYVSPRYLPEALLTVNSAGHRVRSAHNSFTSVACNTGFIGITLFLASTAGAWWLLRRVRKRADIDNLSEIDGFAIGLEIGFVGWAAGGMFHSDHEIDPVFWAVGFAIVLTRLQVHRMNQDEEEFLESEEEVDEEEWETAPMA